MHALTYLTAFAGLASALYVPAIDMDIDFDENAIEERAGCPKLQLVVAPGEATTEGDLGLFTPTVNAVKAAIPVAQVYQIAYPSGYTSPQAIGFGVPAMRAHVADFRNRCPTSKMFLMGYSAGAAIVMDTICGDVQDGANALNINMRHHIIGEIVFGDPTYLPGHTYNAGTCTSNTGQVPRGNPQACFPFGKKLKSYCDENDNVCCGGPGPDAPGDVSVHFSYPQTYTSNVAKFAKAKYTYWVNHS